MLPLFSRNSFVFFAISLAAVLSVPLSGREAKTVAHRVPTFRDWSTRHMVYPAFGTLERLRAVQSDPRAQFAWWEFDQRHGRSLPILRRRNSIFGVGGHQIQRDWSISLGTGTTAPAQFPAEFSLDVTTPDCTNDFVVFPVAVNGSATQPNIVAFNKLYSGTAGATGTCNRTPTGSDTGVAATVLWSYNIHAIAAGGAVPTSPVPSLDGARVAFVESRAGNPAHFHVLAWKSGDGKNAANLQSVTSPKAIITFSGTAPTAGSGTATDLALGASGTDTLSSPFVDYSRDVAYVGNDIGILYRIKNVFCTTSSCGNAPPSLDTSWGSGGAVTVGCGAKLTGADMDFVTLNVYVGCPNGKVYGFTSTGAPLATASIAVGNGSATGGVVDTPIVDSIHGFVYAASGTGAAPNTTHMVVVQATTSLGGPCAGGALCVATFGAAGVASAHDPSFNDPYFSSATSSSWLIYQMGYATAVNLTIYAATFSAARAMTPGAATAAHTLNFGVDVAEYSPTTEFLNGATDYLFFGVMHDATSKNLGAFTINTFPTAAPGAGASGALGNGPSGMVIDNTVASGQASSFYFGVQGTNTAVKLTQAGFN
jgi:hypothetical protein